MQGLSADDTLDLLKDFLPDIEQELRNQLEPDLQEEYSGRAEEELLKIERQAEQEFEEALTVLEHEFEQLKAEKEQQLSQQLQRHQQAHEQREKTRLAQAQERFLQEHFDDRIMTHPTMLQLEQALQAQLEDALAGKMGITKEKKVKQIRIRLQGKEQKERIEADRLIRADIYSKSGLEQAREELHHFRISIAAQKSQVNVRISKVAAEVKALEQKCKQIEYENSDLLIQQMEQEIDELQRQLTQQQSQSTSKFDHSDYPSEPIVDFGPNLSKNKHFSNPSPHTFSSHHQRLNGSLGDAQYIGEDIELDSQDSLDESNSRDLPSLPPPPQGDALSRLLHEPSRLHSQAQEEEIVLNVPARPVLDWDVGRMLRQQWEEDSFDRYLSQRNDKENVSGVVNQNSNFQSLYSEHLKKLNRDSRVPRMRRLSQKAKQQVLAHYGTQRHPRSQAYN